MTGLPEPPATRVTRPCGHHGTLVAHAAAGYFVTQDSMSRDRWEQLLDHLRSESPCRRGGCEDVPLEDLL